MGRALRLPPAARGDAADLDAGRRRVCAGHIAGCGAGIDGKVHVSDQATVWRWREAYQNDFAARMSWTVDDFAHANHDPVAGRERPGGNGSGRDGGARRRDGDAGCERQPRSGPAPDVAYRWLYPEAGLDGAHGAQVSISGEDSRRLTVKLESACAPVWLPGLMPCRGDGIAHIILEVTDDGSPRLTSYRRVVLRVSQ